MNERQSSGYSLIYHYLYLYRVVQSKDQEERPVQYFSREMSVVRSLLSLGILMLGASGIPMQVTINQRQSECLYDKLEEGYVLYHDISLALLFGLATYFHALDILKYRSMYYLYVSEFMTMSVFILSGSNLKATASLEGPIADPDINTAMEMYQGGELFHSNRDKEAIRFKNVVDFEHLSTGGDKDEDADEQLMKIDDETPIDPKDPDAMEKRRKRREQQREAFLIAKQKREEKRILQQKKLREDGEPFQYTTKAPRSGWYRTCVTATWTQVRTKKLELFPKSVVVSRHLRPDVTTGSHVFVH